MRYRWPNHKIACWPWWPATAAAVIIGAAITFGVVAGAEEFPIKGKWEAIAFVGCLAMVATIAPLAPLRWIPDRGRWKARLAQLVLVGLAGGVTAAGVMWWCEGLSQGWRAWLSLLTAYVPLAAESILLTQFFPGPPGVNEPVAP